MPSTFKSSHSSAKTVPATLIEKHHRCTSNQGATLYSTHGSAKPLPHGPVEPEIDRFGDSRVRQPARRSLSQFQNSFTIVQLWEHTFPNRNTSDPPRRSISIPKPESSLHRRIPMVSSHEPLRRTESWRISPPRRRRRLRSRSSRRTDILGAKCGILAGEGVHDGS